MLYKQIYQSPLGAMSMVASEKGLVGLWFDGQKYFERGLTEEISLAENAILHLVKQQLDAYFAGQPFDFSQINLDCQGTDFQLKVWQALRDILLGQTTTYGQLAKDLDCQSAQAIGGAVGRNPVSLIVPCHRVLGSQGQLTGYAGGLDRKIWLLKHEGAKFQEQR